jgi:hypothetical protein
MANLLKRERERLVETVGFASMRCMSIWYFPAGAGATQTISLLRESSCGIGMCSNKQLVAPNHS